MRATLFATLVTLLALPALGQTQPGFVPGLSGGPSFGANIYNAAQTAPAFVGGTGAFTTLGATGLLTLNNGTGTSLTATGTGIFGTGGTTYTLGSSGLSVITGNMVFNLTNGGLASFVAGGNGSAFVINGSSSAIANRPSTFPAGAGASPIYGVAGSDTNIDLTLMAKGTGSIATTFPVSLTGTFKTNRGGTFNLTGAAPPFAVEELIGGYTGSVPSAPGASTSLNHYNISSDQIDAGVGVVYYQNWLDNFGGGSTRGGRVGYLFSLAQTGAITDTVSTQQYTNIAAWATFNYNAGGTAADTTHAKGYGYAFNPQTLCKPGATFWKKCSIEESNIALYATSQSLTIGGLATNGDTLTVTFTGPEITGSPISVTATVGTSNTLPIIANKVMAAIIGNANLAAAGVSASPSVAQSPILNLFWPQQNTVTVSVSTSGGATETLTLGSVVPGASAESRLDRAIIGLNENSAQGFNEDAALVIGEQWLTPTSGQTRNGVKLGGSGGTWPIAWNGKMYGTDYQRGIAGTSNSGPFAPMRAGWGFYARDVNFTLSSGYSLDLPNFRVDGSGKQILGPATILGDSSGLVIDVPGYAGTSCAITNGGGGGSGGAVGNYYLTDILDDANGGQYQPSAINSVTGAITALTTLVPPSVQSSPPGGAFALDHGSGSNATATCIWAQPLLLSLNPSGNIKFAGAPQWSANGSVATTLTSLGPTGSHTTVQEWLTVIDSAGVTRYIPAY